MAEALKGVRVIELARVLAGPWAGQVLADLGAEVIKVEHPLTGDDTRGWGPPYFEHSDGGFSTESAYFLAANRGKRSVSVDFSDPEGLELVTELATQSDVIIENFRVGSLKKYGLEAPKGAKNMQKICAGRQLWNYDNLEPAEKKLIL